MKLESVAETESSVTVTLQGNTGFSRTLMLCGDPHIIMMMHHLMIGKHCMMGYMKDEVLQVV